MKIEGAIFDLDGTLLDSMFMWNNIGEEYLRKREIEPKTNLNEKLKAMSLYQAACYYIKEYNLKDTAEDIIKDITHMIEHFYVDVVQPKPGVKNFLMCLADKGVKMCIATATDRHLAEVALARCNLLGYFGEIFTCACVGKGKDEPDIFLKCLDFLTTEKEFTFVFEDSLHAIETAKNVGFPLVGIYDSFSYDHAKIKAVADYYIYSFEEAEKLF
ncbi:MAG: HAD family phosphatase [Bacillota bacterium]|nr:HAD family phosphatase [Bacillota bacterium]